MKSDDLEIEKIKLKISTLKKYVNENSFEELNYRELFSYMESFKSMLGNYNNDISTLGCLMAKEYILNNHKFKVEFDILRKLQGASGLDIDEVTINGERIIGELKTTFPYKEKHFGAMQKLSINKDIDKLVNEIADYKYFFVTGMESFKILKSEFEISKYNIELVYLGDEIINEVFSVNNKVKSKITCKNERVYGAMSQADAIRKHIYENIIKPSMEKGENKVIVKALSIAESLDLKDRYPNICNAMRGNKIQKEFNVVANVICDKESSHFEVEYTW